MSSVFSFFTMIEVVHPKMPPLISLYGTEQKQFLLYWNRTNLWYRVQIYFSTCFPLLYIVPKIGFSTIRFFKYTSVFKCCYHETELCFVPYFGAESVRLYIWRYISISPASIHSNYQQHHLATLPLYHLYRASIEIWGSIRGRTIVVREIVTLI